eukprot:532297-Hanusia_phi.AAC.2
MTATGLLDIVRLANEISKCAKLQQDCQRRSNRSRSELFNICISPRAKVPHCSLTLHNNNDEQARKTHRPYKRRGPRALNAPPMRMTDDSERMRTRDGEVSDDCSNKLSRGLNKNESYANYDAFPESWMRTRHHRRRFEGAVDPSSNKKIS